MIRRTFALSAMILLLGALSVAWAAKDDVLAQAKSAAGRGEWEQVLDYCQQAVTASPGDEEAWSLMGDAQMALGDTSASVSSFEKALEINPRLPSAVLALTSYYLKVDRLDDAERVVSAAELKDKKGKYDEIKVARGQIHARKGDMAVATQILTSATKKNPKNPLYPQILARIYADKNVLDLAEKYYGEAWALAPGDPGLAYEYGLVLQDKKKYDQALKLFSEVQEKDTSNKTVDYMIGRLFYGARRYGEAAQQFEKAVAKRPEHFLSNYLLGRSYVEFSKSEKLNFYAVAVKWLTKAHQLKPDRADVSAALAEALASQGRMYYLLAAADSDSVSKGLRYDSALVVLREALNFDPECKGVYGQMSRVHDKAGRLDSAIYYVELQLAKGEDATEFSRQVSLLQRHAGLRKAETHQAFRLRYGRTEQEQLIAVLEPVMSDTAMLDKYGLVLANAFIETNGYAKAKQTIAEFIQYKGNDSTTCDAHQLNAYIDLKRERFAEAVPALLAGVRACPKNADMWLQLGDSYYFSDPKKKEVVQRAADAYARACALGSRDGCEKSKQISEVVKTLR